jgi:hypothetical protein
MTIRGRLVLNPDPTDRLWIMNDQKIYHLQFDDSLLATVESLVGKDVMAEGEEVPGYPYWLHFQLSSIAEEG